MEGCRAMLPMLVFGVLSLGCCAAVVCRCVPDQWQGILASEDREFDLTGGRTSVEQSSLMVHYDFANQLFSMTDLKTGNKAVADYKKGFKYVIREDGCRAIRTREAMRRMCLPEDAEHVGDFNLGTDIPVSLWEFNGKQNLTMKTSVIQRTCIPMTEEVYMAREGQASVTNSVYLDVTLGIDDPTVFEPPAKCAPYTHRFRPGSSIPGEMPKHKRGMDHPILLGMMGGRI